MMISQRSSMAEGNLFTISRILSCFIILVTFSLKSEGYSIAKHMDAERNAHMCPELDSCNFRNESANLSSKFERSCACDKACNKFQDCCIDAVKVSGEKSDMKCYNVKGFGGIYMISECPTTFDGDESWRELCENTDITDPSDPLGSMPVTDSETGKTYKNVYCKFCNGNFNLIKFWKPKLDCPFLSSFNGSHSITDEYVLNNLVIRDESWGLNLETVDGMFFLECNIETVMPSELRSKIRRCKADLISDCPSSWKNHIIREKCKSFQRPRFTEDGDGYRNIHCAICNNVNAADLSCLSPQAENLKLFRFSLAHSFALLLDVNIKRGEKVGMIRLCKSGDVYDPFFKKCRELQCLPGFVRRGRKCLPRRSVSKNIRKQYTKHHRVHATTNKPQTSITTETSTAASVKTFDYTAEQNTTSFPLYNTSSYTTSVPMLESRTAVYIHNASAVNTTEIALNY